MPGGRLRARAALCARTLAALAVAGVLTSAVPPAGGEAGGPRVHRIAIRSFAYHPATLEVAAGDTIVWTNRDLVPHTATRTGGRWDSGVIGPDGAWRWAAEGKDTLTYFCVLHPTMVAKLVVH